MTIKNNLTKFSLITLLLLMAVTAFSAPVDRESARLQADAFARKMGRQVSKQQDSRVHQAPAIGGQRATPYYVYDIDGDQGFIIVAGDDRAVPILGYTDSGHFDADQIPDNMQAWLEGYAQAIAALDSLPVTNNVTSVASSLVGAAPVSPLMSSQWNQAEPYNNKCPVINGRRCPTGCVATAMSQIMYYHRWPREATASIPAYSWQDGAYSLPALPSVTFDWNGMQDIYNGNVNGEAVSTLMQYVGQSIHMGYAPESSGSMSAEVAMALPAYFGYDQNVKYISRQGYSVATWEKLVYQELAERRPVYYSGSSYGGGHAFVADGYDGNGLFHINWGWGGWCDGYFRLSVLNPDDHTGIGAGTSSDGFCMGQEIVIGIQPSTGQPNNNKPHLHFSVFDVKNGNTIVYDVWNTLGYGEMEFDIALATVDDNGNVTRVFNDWKTEKLKSYMGYVGVEVSMRNVLRTSGTYKIMPVSRKHGDSEWILGSELVYVEAVVSGNGSLSLRAHPVQDFDVAEIRFPGSRIVNHQQQVDVQIKNKGDEINRELYLFAYRNGDAKKDPLSRTALYLEKDGEETISFFFTPDAEDTYTIDIALDDKDNQKVGTATLKVGGYNLSRDLTTVSARVTASHPSVVDAENVAMVIDDNLGTKYCANVPAGNSVWLRYQLDSPICMTKYSVASANDAPERDPATWVLQGSNDGNNWEDIDRRTGEKFADRFELHEYNVESRKGYTWFRLYVEGRRESSATIFQMSEWQLQGVDPNLSGIVKVSAGETSEQQIYTLDGRPVNRQSLKPGIYVSKGKKVIISNPSRQ